jgi:hypothetical protein
MQQVGMRWNKLGCVATSCDASQQVVVSLVLRRNKLCCVATSCAALQQVVLRCINMCCVATS